MIGQKEKDMKKHAVLTALVLALILALTCSAGPALAEQAHGGSAEGTPEQAQLPALSDEYAEIFGMPDEGDDSKAVITLTLPAAKVQALRQAADKAGMSLSAYIDSITENETKEA